MGTAGLNVERLARLLKPKKVECTLVDGDSALDHCVLRLSNRGRPPVIAFVEYENQGFEPRLVGLSFRESAVASKEEGYPFDWQTTLKLEGARKDDAHKIAEWIEREFRNIAR